MFPTRTGSGYLVTGPKNATKVTTIDVIKNLEISRPPGAGVIFSCCSNGNWNPGIVPEIQPLPTTFYSCY